MAVRKAAAHWNEVKDTGDKSFEEPNAKSQQSVLLAGKGVKLTEPDEAPSSGRRIFRRLSYAGLVELEYTSDLSSDAARRRVSSTLSRTMADWWNWQTPRPQNAVQ